MRKKGKWKIVEDRSKKKAVEEGKTMKGKVDVKEEAVVEGKRMKGKGNIVEVKEKTVKEGKRM
jgi:hypothetical protein